MSNRCLLVDDDALVRLLVGLSLPQAGFEVVAEAANAAEALAAAATARPDIVLVDLMLPGGSGLDTITDLRAILPDGLIVVLSGMPVDQMGPACVRAGADHYLPKSALADIGSALAGLVRTGAQ